MQFIAGRTFCGSTETQRNNFTNPELTGFPSLSLGRTSNGFCQRQAGPVPHTTGSPLEQRLSSLSFGDRFQRVLPWAARTGSTNRNGFPHSGSEQPQRVLLRQAAGIGRFERVPTHNGFCIAEEARLSSRYYRSETTSNGFPTQRVLQVQDGFHTRDGLQLVVLCNYSQVAGAAEIGRFQKNRFHT